MDDKIREFKQKVGIAQTRIESMDDGFRPDQILAHELGLDPSNDEHLQMGVEIGTLAVAQSLASVTDGEPKELFTLEEVVDVGVRVFVFGTSMGRAAAGDGS